ncbi:MAG: hypothetical protein U1E10_09730 [Bdellovibrionales bacterium]|nr:hypothetical protein [Bdellovibrionales bacterium]
MSEAEALRVFTWTASVLCALAVIYECIRIRKKSSSYFIESDWFLPIYFAGILQWTLFGFRTSDLALIVPCALQLLFMIPVLRVWFRRRLQA